MYKEDLIHYCWRFRKFTSMWLTSTDGQQVEVVHTGHFHQNSGPDFFGAKVKIGNTLWSGNVEMHIKASDWTVHQHQMDKAYDNVILHVVYEADIPVYRSDGTEITTVEVKDLLPENIVQQYLNFQESKEAFPCFSSIKEVPLFHTKVFLERVLIERLEEKAELFFELFQQLNGQWEEALYVFTARAFGFKINALPFELLAKSIPQKILAKYKNNPKQIEALLFGNAGFLNSNFEDAYANELKSEYAFLKNKHHLTPIDASMWKFLRMRPSNFPTRRLAQFAAFIVQSEYLCSKILDIKEPKVFKTLFEHLPVHKYWETHYRFEKESKASSTQLGETSVENILLNAMVVFLYSYGKYFSNEELKERALNLLEILKAEHNSITQKYLDAGVKVENGFYSQALIQLHHQYCMKKKCMHCGIGIKLIST